MKPTSQFVRLEQDYFPTAEQRRVFRLSAGVCTPSEFVSKLRKPSTSHSDRRFPLLRDFVLRADLLCN